MRRQILTTLLLLLPATLAAAPRDARATAEAFVASRHPWQPLDTVVTADPLPEGGRFASCGKALEAFLPAGARVAQRTTIGVKCGDIDGWTLYLPVNVQAFAQVLVAKQALAPNQPVLPSQLEPSRRDIGGLSYGYLTRFPGEGNWKARQLIQAGQPLSPGDLVADALIRRGQTVTLRVKVGSIEISQRGEALSDAPLNGRVNVKNRESGRVVDGMVIGDGVVDVR